MTENKEEKKKPNQSKQTILIPYFESFSQLWCSSKQDGVFSISVTMRETDRQTGNERADILAKEGGLNKQKDSQMLSIIYAYDNNTYCIYIAPIPDHRPGPKRFAVVVSATPQAAYPGRTGANSTQRGDHRSFPRDNHSEFSLSHPTHHNRIS